jgi:CRISPR-associated endonuclease/helicase Cas3
MNFFVPFSRRSSNLGAKSGETRGHSLLAHTLDVAAVAGTLLVPFHAGFPGDERSAMEQRVRGMFGRSQAGHRPGRALLTPTQVAEQSLDIDFDFMLSDLAPTDLLLQRARLAPAE